MTPAGRIVDWLDLLVCACRDTTQQDVADRLDVSRTTVSLVLRGKYPASTRKLALRVIECYGRLLCPHLDEPISHQACREYATRAAPTSSPREMRHWRACQGCPHRPDLPVRTVRLLGPQGTR